jgi:hypothetical protein
MTEQPIRPIVFDIHKRLEQLFVASEQMMEELKAHEDARVRIAAHAEMRHCVDLVRRTLTVAIQAEAMRDFQAAVLEALADADIVVRREIMGLFEARAAECEPVRHPAKQEPEHPGNQPPAGETDEPE